MEQETLPAAMEVKPQLSATPMELLQTAVTNGASIEHLERLMALQERWLAAEAKRAFDEAKAKLGSFAIVVTKDKKNKQYNNAPYSSLGNLVETVTPFLAQCDLNASWELDQTNGIKITCILAHKAGHSTRASFIAPPDVSGTKNPIQQIKSTITYGRNCTFECVCGIASHESAGVNVDDDGNGSASNGELDERLEWIANCKDLPELEKIFRQAWKDFPTDAPRQALRKAKDAKKEEF